MNWRMPWLGKIFKDWPIKMLQPVLVNLLTAFLLFSLALVFKPLLSDLIHGPSEVYPIICAAEPYAGKSTGELCTDFFIINREDESFTRAELATNLKNFAHDEYSAPSPDIILTVSGDEPFEVLDDENFNRDKGYASFDYDTQDRAIHIRIERIEPRAIMKYTIVIRDLPYISSELSRMAKSSVPFDHYRYLDGCYKK